ncbi:MAG: class I SAM-dependent RNA methyltransferase [Deltaproteobacteria bacterium]|nr:class I SAM-dependent RNA methyltransferase [Deltaproteobacteria bacterium]
MTALAAGGDGVARDEGRVTFVPRTAPGDRVRVRLTKETKSFARGEVVEIVEASPDRVAPPCPHFTRGCGGCAWQHVARPAQLAAKQAIVAGALRKLAVPIEPVADPCPPLGWRRRARFHIAGGRVGLYREGTREVLPIDSCPQLVPALDAAYRAVVAASPPDGELTLVLGHKGEVVVGVERPWKLAEKLVGKAGIVGVVAGEASVGRPRIEIEPGLQGGPAEFAQASAEGNAALIALARGALGEPPPVDHKGESRGFLLELHAGSGNLTRAFRADGWRVTTSDITPGADLLGPADEVLARVTGPFDAIVLDPPRTGAAEAVPGILAQRPWVIVYVSCDPATLARDAERLIAGGYRAERAWPLDLMPQTAHVEVVLRLTRG